ncbi:BRCT domain-containing protein [Quillaja saponaria]|uniref:BRCT domain-containing protein n=1 Tax=Quillaja saponaria TaxID=32244 RepID=A0AAD7Q9X3_QUISA|nr:BRCT domain-containing protein [Quillaja saponaria]
MLETNYLSKMFLNVRFVLSGFDPISENKVRAKLVNCGGVDIGLYSQNCTHVIVDKLVYDDPKCVAARNDGKTLVTALWVDHSFDLGMPVDATSIMYRPLKDLNGISGAKNLLICLTGYQRQDRDDIMTMVDLMGAQFSKPLVANKVTHLICYKFEGEKYELAKRLKTIKLVNHRWLEDCGYELEMMEAEAKDSEEETEDATLRQSEGRRIDKSPQNLKTNIGNEYRSDQLSRFLHVDDPNLSCQVLAISKDEAFGELPDVHFRTPDPRSNDVSKEVGCRNHCVSMNASSVQLPDPDVGISESRKVGNDLTSSRSIERPSHSDAKVNAGSYSRNTSRRFTLPRYSEERSDDVIGHSKSPLGDLNYGDGDDLENLSSRMGKARDGISSPCIDGSQKGTDLVHGGESNCRLPQKRISEVSYTNLKLPKVSPDGKLSDRSPAANCKTQESRPTSLSDCPETNDHFSAGNGSYNLDHNANLSAAQNSKVTVSSSKTAPDTLKSMNVQDNNAYQKTPQTSIQSLSESFCNANLSAAQNSKFSVSTSKTSSITLKSMDVQDDSAYQKTPQTNMLSLSESIYKNPDIADGDMGRNFHDVYEEQPQNEKQDVECASPINRTSEIESSGGIAHLNLCKEGSDNLVNKPPRKKMFAKKSFASRSKLIDTANKKGAFYLSKTTSCDTGSRLSAQCEETGDYKKSLDADKLELYTPTVDAETVSKEENVIKSKENAESRTDLMDDETEAPEDKVEYELEKVPDENKSEVVTLSKKAEIRTEETSKSMPIVVKSDDGHALVEDQIGTEPQKAVCDRNVEMADSNLEGPGVKGKVNKVKKRPMGKTKKRTTPVARGALKTKEAADEVEIQSETKDESEMETQKKALRPSRKNESYSSFEVEKENKPVTDDGRNISHGKHCGDGKSAMKPRVKEKKTNIQKSKKTSLDLPSGKVQNLVKIEPVCFILSGHRLQRKEFQQVIRRLKGRFCRDSHQWSYQATHFIAPDPIRRTEKFFAAAASGRWILKTDYLAASSQAGKFLQEEPYEWHKNGLSQDGAINMEAPRKWRLLRERTGHGAFYGMRIIVYGDCIAPPLDTLKRVVKAGDGAILATAPPYTRFLDTGVDYAIVSPGMLRVDLWIQEFLKHEIPCVVADYLVEYVCKPGFSLDRHVLYSTHTWAGRSYNKLQSIAEDIVEEFKPLDDCDNSDITCQVCGSRDRGDVMLICGDEGGSVGCGVGTHIDCCDPPLHDIPDEDWFCPKCSTSKNCSNSSRKRKKVVSSTSKTK